MKETTIITKNNTKWNDIVVSLQMREILNLKVEMEMVVCVRSFVLL